MPTLCRLVPVLIVGLGLLLPREVRADLIFFKDGFTLHGMVRQGSELLVDPVTGTSFRVPKGFFILDDDARRIIFSPKQVQDANDRNLNADYITLLRNPNRILAKPMDTLGGVDSFGEFNANWQRPFRVFYGPNTFKVQQRVSILTPQYLRGECFGSGLYWSAFYQTQELGPETTHYLLCSHPDLSEPTDKPDADRRLRIFRFLLQAGWYDYAERELNSLLRDLPDTRERVEENRKVLQHLRVQRQIDELEKAHRAGRHRWAQEKLAPLPKGETDEKLLFRIEALKDKYDAANKDLAQAQRHLKELTAQLGAGIDARVLEEATGVILAELNLDNTGRLEAFLTHAAQAELQRKNGQKPQESPTEILSLAVTGWLLGNGSAENNPETARRLWQTRQLVLQFQRSHDHQVRQRLADSGRKDGIAFDELAQLIRFLPPPEPEAKVEPGTVELKTKLPWGGRSHPYYLQLPPEYHPNRTYPVLMALHAENGRADAFLERWSELATQHGYILVAPVWNNGVDTKYQFTNEEHLIVLDVLRDLRRRFNVDSDRVFLTGLSEGGTMAFDVGLAHPDKFAGIIPISARPRYFIPAYWRNAQYLPFYIVTGEMGADSPKGHRQLLDQWIPRGYPALYVEYKGRALEWFSGELPTIFDWMNCKKRQFPDRELGRLTGPGGEEFQIMRHGDSHYYWLSTDVINGKNINDANAWRISTKAAWMQARIYEGNQINIFVNGLEQVSVWLTNKGMIDFSKPVAVRVNGKLVFNNGNQPLKPDFTTLLEDFYVRGDRQLLFVYRIDANKF